MNNHLTDAIINIFRQESSANAFLSRLLSDATVYLFGGAIRDYLDGKIEFARDIDFVIESNVNDKLDILNYLESLENTTYKKNRYDGYKVNFNNRIAVDVWNLKDTWAFRSNKLTATATNLMKSVYLNIDALVYSLSDDTFLDNCNISYLDIINKHLLDIVFDETPFEELNLLRALVFRKRYSLELSPKLTKRLMYYIKNDKSSTINSFMKLQIEHYNQVVISQTELSNVLYALENVPFTSERVGAKAIV